MKLEYYMGGFGGRKGKGTWYHYIIIAKIKKNIIENESGKQYCSYNSKNNNNKNLRHKFSQKVKNLNIENYKPIMDGTLEDSRRWKDLPYS